MRTRILALVVVCVTAAACEVAKGGTGLAPSPVGSAENIAANSRFPHSGEDLIAYIAAHYPEKLAGGIGYEERARNMEFIRDRTIETGICGGMDLGRNMKRGTGPFSADAIAWRHDGTADVVDIAGDWDNGSHPLELHWFIVGGPAGYDAMHPDCSTIP
jgi:hypothetical protein